MVHPDFPVQGVEAENQIIDRRDAPDKLFDLHHRYKLFHQTQSKGSELYMENGHPDTEEYRLLRAFFEHLQWAANSNARFYSFESDTERTEYWGPKLAVTGDADLIPPRQWEEHASHIERTELDDENTLLHAGSWIIKTENEDFFRALKQATTQYDTELSNITVTPEYEQQYYNWNEEDHFAATWSVGNFEEFKTVKQIVDEYVDPLTTVSLDDIQGQTSNELEEISDATV